MNYLSVKAKSFIVNFFLFLIFTFLGQIVLYGQKSIQPSYNINSIQSTIPITIEAKIEETLKKLTLEEKVALCHGRLV